MKILLDMNLSPAWTAPLEAAGHRAFHWSLIGAPDATDRTLLDWARDNAHVVLTNDLDFSALLAMTRGRGPSVLQVRLQNLLPDAAGSVVLHVLRAHADDLAAGAIITVSETGTRVRVLPLAGPA